MDVLDSEDREEQSQLTATTKSSRLNWTHDELILALDLYFKDPAAHGNDKHPGVIELSELLQDLPIHPPSLRKPNFRNPNAVGLKLVNFRALDPKYAGVGLQQGARKDREVWDQYSEKRDLLTASAQAIRELYKSLEPQDYLYEVDDAGATEGGVLHALHKRYERDGSIVRKKKRSVFHAKMALKCEICGFDFAEIYGELGNEFAECHHTKPVSKMKHGDTTKLEDLSIVCANCHRMLHRSRDLLSITALQEIVERERSQQAVKNTFGGSNM